MDEHRIDISPESEAVLPAAALNAVAELEIVEEDRRGEFVVAVVVDRAAWIMPTASVAPTASID